MNERIESTPEWAAVRSLVGSIDLPALFESDSRRAEDFTLQVGDLLVDTSKNLWTREVRAALAEVARRADVASAWRRMRDGDAVNESENRAVAHWALRSPTGTPAIVAGRDVSGDVHSALGSLARFADDVRSGRRTSATGQRFSDVVNIGIGGSDLGPAMAYDALRAFRDGPHCHFVSNVDPANTRAVLDGLDPARTLVIVSSKTFTTAETMANAVAVREWLVEGLGADAVGAHFVAVTTNTRAAGAFGVDPDAVFGFWDWVGGRYSLASAIGLSLAIAVGPVAFGEMLAGMHLVDEHVNRSIDEPLANAPLVHALLSVWYSNFLGAETRAVVPYAHDLRRFPAYLQQLDMESNGKSVDRDGRLVALSTGPIVWGGAGTDGQHAYFQLLHQGTHLVPVDFIGFARPVDGDQERHDALMANLFAQSQALAFGRPLDEALPNARHRVFPGNRPSTVIMAPALTPSVLGQLVAFYEHSVFFQGAVWGINSFDQWGVELGKDVAHGIGQELVDGRHHVSDPATRRLIEWYRSHRHRSVE
ncbi:MAG: glucose-6-phosphate isomerase [Acidimicrobiales bacterium mtb01]|nr:glucose-6-phosphate isomerase [Actinomycetota bacterium]TEX45651.1 MAG: glucose-6-phosphate isomerase [Acidimicrobiales bacterium mtb01]